MMTRKSVLFYALVAFMMMSNSYLSPIKAQEMPTAGLIAHYPFNGNAHDKSGNGKNGKVKGASLVADRFGNVNSAYYLGGNDYINTNISTETGLTFSISGWGKALSTTENKFIYRDSYWDGRNRMNAIVLTESKFAFSMRSSTSKHGGHDLSSGNITRVADNDWHHIVVTIDNATKKMRGYFDGVLVGTVAFTGSQLNTVGRYWKIGKRDDTEQYFKGYVDDVRFYNRSLSPGEIKVLYHEGGWGVGSIAKVTPQPARVRPKPAPKADRTPPIIQINSPAITRGMKQMQQEKTILVKGRASDKSGIFEVLVNGVEAQLDADGGFWAEVKLRVGENRITVKATDMHENAASTTFTIVREAGARPAPVAATRTREQEEFQFGEYHALLIAVQDYSDRSINDLDYPIEDAEKIRAVLLEQYTFKQENIHFLKNPSRRDILKKLGELRRLDEDDNLLIYYAGHGYWDEKAEQGYWLPRDARQDDDTDWISNSDIKDRIRSIETRHTLLISDACFSGGIFKTREAFIKPDISIRKVYEMPSRKALTSGNLKTVPDKSVFVDFLVKRLRQNKEPYLYSEKLYVNMRDAVTNHSPNNQTPLFGVINGAGDEGGDFIFVRKR